MGMVQPREKGTWHGWGLRAGELRQYIWHAGPEPVEPQLSKIRNYKQIKGRRNLGQTLRRTWR